MPPATVLFDYGEVLCTAQPPGAVRRMVELAGVPERLFRDRYWARRRDHDAGLPARDYWSGIVGRSPLPDEQLAALVEADNRGWSELDPAALALLDELRERGTRLFLLSNAPRELADELTGHPVFAAFEALMFSGHLGLVKPDPAIFHHALGVIGIPPDQVTFVDDRPENVAAAAALGIDAVHFTTVPALRTAWNLPS